MIVTFWKSVFVADTSPDDVDERKVLSKAGFKLHDAALCNLENRFCKACRAKVGRRFWSDRIEAATRVRRACNERALKVMRDHLARLRASAAMESDIDVPVPKGRTFLPFQKAGIAYALSRKDTLIADEMGTGKTIQALGFVNKVEPANVLVLCPKTMVLTWADEAAKWLVRPYDILIPETKSDEIEASDGKFVITTYEKTIGDTPLSRSLKRTWDVLVLDEAHLIKNPESARSIAVLGEDGLMRRGHRTLFLTGTPIENYPKEIWPIAAAVCPAKFGDWWDFARRYCGLHKEERDGRVAWVSTGATNLGELQQRLRATFMVRRLKSQVLPELPPKRRQLVVLENAGKKWSEHPQFKRWKEVYERAYEEKMAAVESATTEVEYKRAARELEEFVGIAFTEVSEFRHATALAKLPLCLSYIDDVLASGLDSLVIFAHHLDVLQKIKDHLGEEAVLVHGGTSLNDRKKAVEDFQAGRKKIFVGGLKAAGVGITLTRSSTVIFVEIDWVPGVMNQAEDRLCRIGQRKMVHVIHLILGETLDANMVRRVVKKQEVIDQALDRPPEQLQLTHPVKRSA